MNKIIKLIAFISLLSLFLTGCYNSSDAQKALDDAGFTNIEITGHAWFSCGKDDFYSTSFKAKNIHGKEVSGAVCSGFLFKNSTIRF